MTRFGANLMLFFAAFCWGAGNVAQKTVLDDLGPMLAMGLRSLIALAFIMPLVVREAKSSRPITDGQWRELALVSVFFCLALFFQQFAYGGTSVTNASFLVNTTVVFTPILAFAMMGERPGLLVLPAVALALAGVALMGGGLTVLQWGDICCIVSAILYSVWIVLVARVARTMERPFAIAACQFGFAAVVGTVFGLACETISLAALTRAAPELLILGVVSTGIAYSLQAIAQRWTPPSDAAVVMSAESVFGAATAAILLGEQLSPAGTLGAVLILAAILLIQVPVPEVLKWRRPVAKAGLARPPPLRARRAVYARFDGRRALFAGAGWPARSRLRS